MVRIDLRIDVLHRKADHLVRVGYSDGAVRFQVSGSVCDVDSGFDQPRIGRHDRFRHQIAWVLHVVDVPFIRIAAADAGKVRSGALRAPLEWVIVHGLGG